MATKKAPPKSAWKPGESGNPTGRPVGCGRVHKWRAGLDADVPEILAALVQQAKEGDVMAARLILERALPALKPSELAQVIDLQGNTLTDKGQSVLAAVADGSLAVSQGAQLMTAIGTMARVAEIDELAQRITKLEEKQNGKS